MTTPFVHLSIHTEYSLVDGIVRIKPLVKRLAEQGYGAVALSDQSNLFGMVKLYRAAEGAGLKLIIGAEFRLVLDGEDGEQVRIKLYAYNYDGYLNINELISKAYMQGQERGVPRINEAWLEEHKAGLIALSGGFAGVLGRTLLQGDFAAATTLAERFAARYPDSFYVEVTRTDRPGEEDYLHNAVTLCEQLQLPIVATNDVVFIDETDFEAHEARVCIHDGRTLDDPKRPKNFSPQQYVRSPEEMVEVFSDLPEALENTLEIAKRCNVDITLGENFLPDCDIPDGMTMDDYFRKFSHDGLEERFPVLLDESDPDYATKKQAYIDRLDIELDVIINMGFPGYFLIVADFIQWAKNNDIPVGPGRGSGAGSLVAYAQKITDLDPLEYDLLFERFLNPERVSMPDFDVDFCMEGRDRVIAYVADKYGRDKVSQIATHGTMAAKAVVRDVGRVLGHSYGFVDRVAKLIPFEIGMTLTKALEQEEDLKNLYDSDEEVKALIDLALKLEGVARNVGKHAGGVVISPSKLTDFSPIYCEEGSKALVTQYDKDDVEAVGLVKFDFLGLRTLTIIDWAVSAINEQKALKGEEPIDIAMIPLDDADSFTLLKECKTTAVFQLESRGMKDLIRRLQPDCFEDIIALVALFRPGPLGSGMVDDFIARKHGKAEVAYPHPEYQHEDLKPVLEPTYGIILYQEQVMQIAQVLANFSLGGADLLRRAMGKKKPEVMAEQRKLFSAGAAERGISEELAGPIFDLMEKFAGYGFNKSHSAAYALVSYQTAWLKAHYPAAFMAAVLSSDMDNTDKVVIFIEECREMELKVVPPDVNHSRYKFYAKDDNTIVYGMGAIKGVGQAAIESMVEEREANGPYKDLFDFCCRIDMNKANRRTLESMIRAGCLDSMAPNRASLMEWLPEALQFADQATKNAAAGQTDLFGLADDVADVALPTPDLEPLEEWPDNIRLAAEKETLGLYLTGHPIDQYESEINNYITGRLGKMIGQLSQYAPKQKYHKNDKTIIIAGLIVELRTRISNSGGKMAFLTLDDRTARQEVAVFTEAYEQYGRLLAKDAIVVIEGSVSEDHFSGGYRITTNKVFGLEQARAEFARRLEIDINQPKITPEFLQQINTIFDTYKGNGVPVFVSYQNEVASAQLALDRNIRPLPGDECLDRLRQLLGVDAVRLEY